MSLLDTLRPARPPEPAEARVVRLLGMDEPKTPAAKLRYDRERYARNRERLAAAERERYHRRKARAAA